MKNLYERKSTLISMLATLFSIFLVSWSFPAASHANQQTPEQYNQQAPLVSTAWLAEHLNDKNLVIFGSKIR